MIKLRLHHFPILLFMPGFVSHVKQQQRRQKINNRSRMHSRVLQVQPVCGQYKRHDAAAQVQVEKSVSHIAFNTIGPELIEPAGNKNAGL